MQTEHFDIVIIGTGAGGGTMAHALAGTGARVLIVERGDVVPREPENWSPEAVWKDLRYRTTETWLDAGGREFRPYTHYCVGGNTKFWGSVLYRLRREDFCATEHIDGLSPAWPITYETLAPYYEQAERLYHVHGECGHDPTEPAARTVSISAGAACACHVGHRRTSARAGPPPVAAAARLDQSRDSDGCVLCRTCNSFPCQIQRKSDAEVCCVASAVRSENITLLTRATAQRLVTDPSGKRVEAVEIVRDRDRMRVTADRFVVSCGAVNSAVLLLRSANDRHPHGLANSSGMVGTRYMAHLATMLQGVGLRVNDDDFQKTLAINDFYLRGPDTPYPLGQIQSQGRTDASMAKVVGDEWRYKFIEMRHIPLWAYEMWVSRATDWLAMTEDLPRAENRVMIGPGGRPVLEYQPNNLRAHARLVDELRGVLARLGYWSPKLFAHSTGVLNTTHQCGTLAFGTDPRSSVLDPYCRTHDVENLFVVDASFFPSSAAVNPGLTIAAQALRVAEHIRFECRA